MKSVLITAVGVLATLVAAVLLAVLLAMPNLRQADSFEDLLISGSPLVLVAAFGLAVATLCFRRRVARSPFRTGALGGLIFGTFPFIVLVLGVFARDFDLVTADGTAFWGLIGLPAVVIGLPAAIGGCGIGAGIGFWAKMSTREAAPS